MAKDLNKVMITGRLGADPEMRYTPQGSAVTTFRVASGRSWRTADGEPHEDTEWFRIVAWDKLGEVCNQYLTKGARVYVEGRLQTRKWQDKDGQDRYSTEVVAGEMIMLDSRKPAERDAGIPDDEPGDEDVFFPPARPAAPEPPARAPGVRRSSAARSVVPLPDTGRVSHEDEELPF